MDVGVQSGGTGPRAPGEDRSSHFHGHRSEQENAAALDTAVVLAAATPSPGDDP